MCGLAGVLASPEMPPDALRALLDPMLDALAHRGPDEQRIAVVAPGVALAHSRLRIIDLAPEAGQPMTNEDGSIVVVFNGEIYNHRALRADLEARGHRFRARCDTEVLVHLYEEAGESMCGLLEGMFAFALWDKRREILLLARDRLGKKPLYLSRDERGHLLFASEIEPLYRAGVHRRVDTSVLPSYLAHGYVAGERTLVDGVVKLPPGTFRTATRRGLGPTQAYFGLEALDHERPSSFAEAVGGVRRRVRDAVARRLESDVPLGAFLSGGLDSTVVVSVAQELLGKRLDTFALGFSGGQGFDETPWARLVADRLGTRHHEIVLQPDLDRIFPVLLARHGEPFADSSALPSYVLADFARQHVTVALTGDGGDEAFCGYERMRAALLTRLCPAPVARVAEAVLAGVADGGSYGSRVGYARRFFGAASRPVEDGYRLMSGLFDDAWMRRLLGREIPRDAVTLPGFDEARGLPLLPRILWGNVRTYLAEDLLPKVDRATMAVGLEARSPLLDTTLLSYTLPLPARWHLRNGRLKALLRAAFADDVPREVLGRRKHGFGVPLGEWLRGGLRPWLDTLVSPGARLSGYLDRNAVRGLVDEHLSTQRDHGGRLFALFALERWLQIGPADAGSCAP